MICKYIYITTYCIEVDGYNSCFSFECGQPAQSTLALRKIQINVFSILSNGLQTRKPRLKTDSAKLFFSETIQIR